MIHGIGFAASVVRLAALLIERNSYGLAAGYMVGSVAASLSALFFGLALFRTASHLP